MKTLSIHWRRAPPKTGNMLAADPEFQRPRDIHLLCLEACLSCVGLVTPLCPSASGIVPAIVRQFIVVSFLVFVCVSVSLELFVFGLVLDLCFPLSVYTCLCLSV